MRSLRKTLQVLIIALLFVLPTATLGAQSGGAGTDPYTMDDMAILALEPWGDDVTGGPPPAQLPETGAVGVGASDPYTMDDMATLALEPWGPNVTDGPPPVQLPETGAMPMSAPDLSSMTETEPGDVYWASAATEGPAPAQLPETGVDLSTVTETEPGDMYWASPATEGPAPAMLPETGSTKIPEPAIQNWRFEGFTLVPDWAEPEIGAEPETLPETGAGPTYYFDVPSEPPLLVPVTPEVSS